MSSNNAPVVLFTYKRLDTLQRTVAFLQKNYLAGETELYIFCDGSKSEADNEKVAAVQNFCDAITGFKKVSVHKSPSNKGLANSVKAGVSFVLEKYQQAIVLEDDLETTPNFLDFMNQALETYRQVPQVFSISGYTFPIEENRYSQDVFFHPRGQSWGWATWADRWKSVNWQVLKDIDPNAMRNSKGMGSDWVSLIRKAKDQTSDSWAIPWIVNQYKQGLYTVYPTVSKVYNIGFGPDATHTHKSQHRFATQLDDGTRRVFQMKAKVEQYPHLIKQYNKRLSYWYRAYSLIYFYLHKRLNKRTSNSLQQA